MSTNTILASAPLTSTGYHLKANGTTLGNSLIWDNGTNVGIGNTNTSYTLDVSGSLRATTSAYFATASGSVGIGVSSTSAKAEIRGNGNTAINSQGTLFVSSGGTATQTAEVGGQITFGAWLNGDLSVPYPVAAIKGVTESSVTDTNKGALIFATMNNTTNAERMRITSAGNLGIGTSSPATKFELAGSSGNFQIASSGAEVFFTRNENNDFLANGGSSAGIRFGGQSQLRFATGTSLSTRMTIDSSGNVLFNNVAAQLQWEGGNYWTWRTVTSGTEFWLYRGDTGASPLIMTTGNVLRLSSLAGAGSRTVTADALGNLSASSDSSLKQEDASHKIEGLAEILKLKPRAYKWLSDIEIRGEEATTEIGFFANEVNAIIPSAAPKGNDDLYGFYDRAVIAALVKAVQEQNQTIQNLQEQINILAK
jgi:hypothetical protein